MQHKQHLYDICNNVCVPFSCIIFFKQNVNITVHFYFCYSFTIKKHIFLQIIYVLLILHHCKFALRYCCTCYNDKTDFESDFSIKMKLIKANYNDWPVEEDASSNSFVRVGACPCSPHLLALQVIKHCLNVTQNITQVSSMQFWLFHHLTERESKWIDFQDVNNMPYEKLHLLFDWHNQIQLVNYEN